MVKKLASVARCLLLLILVWANALTRDETTAQLQVYWDQYLQNHPQQVSSSLNYSLFFDHDKFIESYVDEIRGSLNYTSLVSLRRLRATAVLTKAALLIPHGDIVETGVFKGGTAAIIMRMLIDFDLKGRQFYAFDSFDGLPSPDEKYDGPGINKGGFGYKGLQFDMFASQEDFEKNMKSWKAWNTTIIRVVKGFFNTTLPVSTVKKISFLRLDGYIVTSTYDGLKYLYRKVVPGG